MKTTSLLRAVLLASTLAACGNLGDESAQYGVTWRLADQSHPFTCDEVGAVDVAVTTTQAGAMVSQDFFPCANLSGTTSALPLGEYTVTAQLLDQGASPIGAPVTLSTEAPDPFALPLTINRQIILLPEAQFELPAPAGSMRIIWKFKVGGVAKGCAGANVANVTLTLTDSAGQVAGTGTLDCDVLAGEFADLDGDAYDITVDAEDGNGNVLGTKTTSAPISFADEKLFLVVEVDF